MTWFEGFEAKAFKVNGVEIFARIGGPADAPPLLLLHGYPQTHAMWHRVAPALARTHGLAGRERMEREFSIQRMVQDYVAVYDQILRGGGG